jgi:hypothetical protein
MDARIAAARQKLDASTLILGHHYQRDEVIRFADFTGDSYKLSKAAAETSAKASAAGWSAPPLMPAPRLNGRLPAGNGSCFCPTSTSAATPATPWAFRSTK